MSGGGGQELWSWVNLSRAKKQLGEGALDSGAGVNSGDLRKNYEFP